MTRPIDLCDQAALWLAGHGSQRSVVEHACAPMLQDVGGDALAVLAGHPFAERDDSYGFELDLRAALRELGFKLPPRDTEQIDLRALESWCARLAHGEVSALELAAWVRQAFGHDGLRQAGGFVVAWHDLSQADPTEDDWIEAEKFVMEIAHEILAEAADRDLA